MLNGRLVGYRVAGEYAVADGDIIIGTVAEIQAASKNPTAAIPFMMHPSTIVLPRPNTDFRLAR